MNTGIRLIKHRNIEIVPLLPPHLVSAGILILSHSIDDSNVLKLNVKNVSNNRLTVPKSTKIHYLFRQIISIELQMVPLDILKAKLKQQPVQHEI